MKENLKGQSLTLDLPNGTLEILMWNNNIMEISVDEDNHENFMSTVKLGEADIKEILEFIAESYNENLNEGVE